MTEKGKMKVECHCSDLRWHYHWTGGNSGPLHQSSVTTVLWSNGLEFPRISRLLTDVPNVDSTLHKSRRYHVMWFIEDRVYIVLRQEKTRSSVRTIYEDVRWVSDEHPYLSNVIIFSLCNSTLFFLSRHDREYNILGIDKSTSKTMLVSNYTN